MNAEIKPLSPTEVARTWFRRVWNEADASAIGDLFADDGVAEGMGPPIHGPHQFAVLHASFVGAFAGLKLTLRDSVESESRVAVRVHVTGTHKKTGAAIDFEGASIVNVCDGKITHAWNCFDFHTMVVQCGEVAPTAFERALTP